MRWNNAGLAERGRLGRGGREKSSTAFVSTIDRLAYNMSSTTLSLQDKTALITGASQGIGASIAHKLASLGANVIVNYMSNKAKADETVQSIAALGTGRAVAVQGDVSSAEGGKKLVQETVRVFGKIDILVLNAGIMSFGNLESLTEDSFDKHFNTNVKGPLFLMQAAVPHMPKGGRVVFFSTGLVINSGIMPNYLVYTATKGAVEQLSRVLAKDLGAKGITVNTVAPGATATEMFFKDKTVQVVEGIKKISPFGRLGEPDEIAEAVAFLVGPGATWVSGTVLRVTGAMFV